jgi:hypothetical protein
MLNLEHLPRVKVSGILDTARGRALRRGLCDFVFGIREVRFSDLLRTSYPTPLMYLLKMDGGGGPVHDLVGLPTRFQETARPRIGQFLDAMSRPETPYIRRVRVRELREGIVRNRFPAIPMKFRHHLSISGDFGDDAILPITAEIRVTEHVPNPELTRMLDRLPYSTMRTFTTWGRTILGTFRFLFPFSCSRSLCFGRVLQALVLPVVLIFSGTGDPLPRSVVRSTDITAVIDVDLLSFETAVLVDLQNTTSVVLLL